MNDLRRHPLVATILASNQEERAGVLEQVCATASYSGLLDALTALHDFESNADTNTYQRVRAQFQIAAIYRYYLPQHQALSRFGTIAPAARALILACRY